MNDDEPDGAADREGPAPIPAPTSAPAKKTRRWQRELASWLIPVFALVFGFGYRCVREPIFVDGPNPAHATAKPGESAFVGVFPRPEGKRKVTITGAHLSGASDGLQLVRAVARNIKEGPPILGQQGTLGPSHPLSSVEFQASNGYYLVLELKAVKAGKYTASGVKVNYHSGIQRGTHRMKVNLSFDVK